MELSNFIENNYISFAVHNNIQCITSYIDGLKESQRKCLYTVKEKNPQDIKVDALANKIADFTHYNHGAESLMKVLVKMNQPFENNILLLEKKSFFGSRLLPNAASPRYIKTSKSPIVDYIFPKDYDNVIVKQYNEGTEIEPKFYVPVIPLAVINGSEGISVGFAQKVLPRSIESIINYFKGKPLNDTPSFPQFKGKVYKGENKNQWIIQGIIEPYSKDELIIKELPINYNLSQYREVLEDLLTKKIIKDYQDKSDTKKDKFEFIVKFYNKIKNIDDSFYRKLKLVTTVTENFTFINENNTISQFENLKEVLDAFLKIKLDYTGKFKKHKLEQFKLDIEILENKIKFLKAVIDDRISFKNKTKEDLEKDLKEYLKVDGSYDYLLNLNIYNLTKNKLDILEKSLYNNIQDKNTLEKLTVEEIFLNEINKIT